MSRLLNTDEELFAAAMAQVRVEAWLEDISGDYCLEGSGIVEKITPDTVKLREKDGSTMYYFRYPTMFKA